MIGAVNLAVVAYFAHMHLQLKQLSIQKSSISNLSIFTIMSCFIGLAVPGQLDSEIYGQCICEMQHVAYQAGLTIFDNSHVLAISNSQQKFSLVRNSSYLYTHLQHIIINDNDDELFVDTIVQCLMILKQSFPSKVAIELASDLDYIYNTKKMIEEQIPRRLAGNIKLLAEKGRKQKLNQTEIDRLIYCLNDQIHKDYKHKLRLLSLRVMSEASIDQQIWNSLDREQIKLIDDLSNDQLYQKLGIQVLQRIVRHHEAPTFEIEEIEQENKNPNIQDREQQAAKMIKFEGKIDTKTAFFQLKQSRNIGRVAWIINSLLSMDLASKHKKKLELIVIEICKRINQGNYYQPQPVYYSNFKAIFQQYMKAYQITQTQPLYQQTRSKIAALTN